jgi:hypothetical protein
MDREIGQHGARLRLARIPGDDREDGAEGRLGVDLAQPLVEQLQARLVARAGRVESRACGREGRPLVVEGRLGAVVRPGAAASGA